MTTKVDVYYFGKLPVIPQHEGSSRLNFDGMQCLPYPPLGRDNLTVDNASISTTGENAPFGTVCAQVQINTDGGKVRFEVANQNNPVRVADQTSPAIKGDEQVIEFHPGWKLAFIEAT